MPLAFVGKARQTGGKGGSQTDRVAAWDGCKRADIDREVLEGSKHKCVQNVTQIS